MLGGGFMGRRTVIAGNWKMYKTIAESVDFIKKLAPLVEKQQSKALLAVPYTAIYASSQEAAGTNILIGAQNMHDAEEGAFTGEISFRMLKDVGAEFVILGHSERRKKFHERNDDINRKIKKALKEEIQAILCVGESFEEREKGETKEVLKAQLLGSLAGISSVKLAKIIVAYEPVWAIGTGRSATPQVAQEAHVICRKFISDTWGKEIAQDMVIQYGGSVKPENASELMRKKDIDGLLIGGASLEPVSFSEIVNYKK